MLLPLSRLAAPFLLLALAIPAAAQDRTLPRPVQIQELYACRDIADAAARLACFDREVGELATADQARDISFADRETVQRTRRGLFGFSLPRLDGIFGGGEDEERIDNIETTVVSASADGYGRYRIAMADGSVWVQTDNKIMPLRPREGQKINIKAAALGTYFLSLEGRPSIRVRREQ